MKDVTVLLRLNVVASFSLNKTPLLSIRYNYTNWYSVMIFQKISILELASFTTVSYNKPGNMRYNEMW
jgi:hypothetical protein